MKWMVSLLAALPFRKSWTVFRDLKMRVSDCLVIQRFGNLIKFPCGVQRKVAKGKRRGMQLL